MKIVYMKLCNYIGIYNGMQLREIEFTFNNSNNKITLVVGDNGSGKSTIVDAFSPYPDSYDSIIDGENGSKELTIIDSGNIYNIYIQYTLEGNRRQTKAFISKNNVEMNSNGNVTSYKDFLSSEFDLDPNFLLLSYMSNANKGLVYKTPSERKKAIGYYLSDTEIYNNMYKIFSKKSNTYKTMLRDLNNRLNSLGNRDILISNINMKRDRLNEIKYEIDMLKSNLSKLDYEYNQLDPNNKLMDEFNECKAIIDNSYNITNIPYDELNNSVNTLYINLNNIEAQISNIDNNIISIKSSIDSELLNIDLQKSKLDTAMDINLDTIELDISSLKDTINEIRVQLSKSGIIDMDIAKNELISLYNVIKTLQTEIYDLYNFIDSDIYEYAMIKYVFNNIFKIDINKELYNINKMRDRIDELNKEKNKLLNKIELINSLNIGKDKSLFKNIQFPSSCDMNVCPFVNKGFDILLDAPNNEIIKIDDELNFLNTKDQLDDLQYKIIHSNTVIVQIKNILNIIDNNKQLLSKTNITINLLNKDKLIKLLYDKYSFNELVDSLKILEEANLIEYYYSKMDILNSMENQYNIIMNKKESYKLTLDIIKSMEDKVKEKEYEIISLKSNNDKLKNDRDSLKTKYDSQKSILDKYNELLPYLDRYKSIKQQSSRLLEIEDERKSIESDIYRLSTSELIPLENELKILDGNLVLLDDTINNLNYYNNEYNFIEVLKDCSNPSKQGIQSIFINQYLREMIFKANQLLAMLFNGKYQLLETEIDIDTGDFYMPFIGGGMKVNDIRYGSGSETAMFGMVISIALSLIASSKYNIFRLDELDGELDSNNRYQFMEVVKHIVDILGIDQLIMISHSIELEMSNVDIIQLRQIIPSNLNGNIVYKY